MIVLSTILGTRLDVTPFHVTKDHYAAMFEWRITVTKEAGRFIRVAPGFCIELFTDLASKCRLKPFDFFL